MEKYQSKHRAAAARLRFVSSEPADHRPMSLAISRSCFIRLCCLLSRRRLLGFLQSLSLTLMGSDVSHDWNCQCLDEGHLKNWESVRALAECVAWLSWPSISCTLPSLRRRNQVRQQWLCVRCCELNVVNAAGWEWQHVDGVIVEGGKNKGRYFSRFSFRGRLMEFGGGELIRLIEATATSLSSVYFLFTSVNLPRSPRV